MTERHKMVQTRAAFFEGKVSLQELDLQPAEDQVLVKVHQASICGTDKLLYRGEIPPEIQIPIFPWGHEGGGTIVEVGSKVREYSEGDVVMSFGRGTFADYCLFTLPYGCLPAPEDVDVAVACLGEPLSCAVYAAQEISKQIQLGDVTAIIGAGFAGQVIAQGVARCADTLIVMDLVDEKLHLAKTLGADIIVNPQRDVPEEIVMEGTDGRGVDVVIEASGSGKGLNTASKILRHNGTLAIYSHYLKPFMVNMYRWHEDAFKIIHTCLMHRTKEEMVVGVREACRLVQKGVFSIQPLLTREYQLAEISQAFGDELKDPTSVKTVLVP